MLRHKAFRNVDDLTSFLEKVVPSDVYYSSAYYEDPEREMEKKGWLGADLIFDIDADHIPTPCTKTHDRWICANCGIIGRGLTPQNCPGCGERKFDERTWPCEKCLESAKTETIKLMDILIRDFGFLPEEIRVSFSGHRGYHVQVEREEIRTLNQMARKEIVDYVVGIGLEMGFHGLRDATILTGPILDDSGWRGRIARGTYEFLLKATPEELKRAGLKKKRVDTIIKYKKELLDSWKKGGPWGTVKDLGVDSWRKIVEHGTKIQSARIDTVVTTDIHRLIRLGNTLHGKTALIKIEVPAKEIEDFDPFTDAVVFNKGKAEVIVSDAPKFRLGDEVYGPYKEEKVELPTAVALLLLCKKAAKVIR
ncbi:MAG: DNA primase small subunit PriS [Candidatus Bathyarchaeota archaeon]|nr:MAG: DNA primase small subunit PriS [Candidatus Bathyarchaeota archaeon]